jgi:hypothetical protein
MAPNGFFHADEQIAFSVILGDSWRMLDPDIPFSEFDWASPQELRLITSLILYGFTRLSDSARCWTRKSWI